jgi:hypothetical protein
MEAPIVLCDAVWKDGQRCGLSLRVLSCHSAYSIYDAESGDVRHIQRCVVVCPRCGQREQSFSVEATLSGAPVASDPLESGRDAL